MLGLTPFLLFDGECAEAMRFYQSCFGGDFTLTRLSETPMKAQFLPHNTPKLHMLFCEAVPLSSQQRIGVTPPVDHCEETLRQSTSPAMDIVNSCRYLTDCGTGRTPSSSSNCAKCHSEFMEN